MLVTNTLRSSNQFSLMAELDDNRFESMPFRPIQYLGSKLRALPAILDATSELLKKPGHIVDLFAGTTVVAQAYAARGHTVTAVDAQKYSTVFANAMLGVGRKADEACDFSTLSNLGVQSTDAHLSAPWSSLVKLEGEAIQNSDSSKVRAISSEFPLIWRDAAHPLRKLVETPQDRSAHGEVALMASIYAGSYFGLRQALTIDILRQSVEICRDSGRLSDWQYFAALTALMSAASRAAHSAGKHFAQPLNAGSGKNSQFLDRRLLEDRSVDVLDQFISVCDTINERAQFGADGHAAVNLTAEEYLSGNNRADLYYLDPPYTAQQYSRFYHVLETLCSYTYPELFIGGKVTTGLYPSRRFKSAFSSKRQAPRAFQKMLEAIQEQEASALLSYSLSAASSNGNARMISFDSLLDICVNEFGSRNVKWFHLDHKYRQFNSSSASNDRRDDAEVMIVCKRH